MSVCGVGDGNTPLPGDPDLNSAALTAVAGLGGIHVRFDYPTVNPHAVVHTLLYRSTDIDFATAVLIYTMGGNHHFDQMDVAVGTTYYYWIKMVSINGTVGGLIGPASDTLQPTVDQLLAILEGRLTDSSLLTTLRSKIDSITDVSSGLSDEEQLRLTGDTALSDVFAQINADLDAVDTLVANEVLQRSDDVSAVVAQVNFILAQANENSAAISNEALAWANGTSAGAVQITTLESDIKGASASVQERMETIDGATAVYSLRLDVDGHVSGFGLRNDGVESEFIISADRFAVASPVGNGEPDVFPFIIDNVNGSPVIALNATTMIPDAKITNAMIGGIIQSNTFNIYTEGWAIDKDGDAIFHNVFARGNIEATTIKADVVDVVDTLMISGNAVTVPVSATSTTKTGNGAFQETHTVGVTLAVGCPIHIDVSIFQGYNSGTKDWGLKVTHVQSGEIMVNRIMVAQTDMPGWSSSRTCSVGLNQFKIEWYGEDSTMTGNTVTRLMGVQR